jgi:hypothetical protein
MKKIVLAASLLVVGAFALRAQTLVQSFDDIQFWTGSGPNRSALVLEFSSGQNKISYVWGYRWSGSLMAESMFFGLAGSSTVGSVVTQGADARLIANLTDWGSPGAANYFVNTLTYNPPVLLGGGAERSLIIENNYNVDGTYPALYSLTGNGTWTGSDFVFSEYDGMSTLPLTNGGWFAVAQITGNSTYSFSQPFAAPVPEPSVAILVTIALVFFMLRRRANA